MQRGKWKTILVVLRSRDVRIYTRAIPVCVMARRGDVVSTTYGNMREHLLPPPRVSYHGTQKHDQQEVPSAQNSHTGMSSQRPRMWLPRSLGRMWRCATLSGALESSGGAQTWKYRPPPRSVVLPVNDRALWAGFDGAPRSLEWI